MSSVRRSKSTLVALLAVAFVVGLLIVVAPWAGGPERIARDDDGARSAPSPDAHDLVDVNATTTTADVRSAIEGAAPASDVPACVLTGTVVDGGGAPIAGVVAELGGFREWSGWSTEGPAPWNAHSVGFTAATDAAGVFRFEVAPPTASVQRLSVAKTWSLARHEVHFGAQRVSSTSDVRSPLTSGTTDLGVIRLVATGAVSGRIVDAVGAPIEGARLYVSAAESEPGSEALSARDGSFLVGHLRPGSMRLHVEHAQHTDTVVWVDVAARELLEGVVITLGRTFVIEGRVRDDAGVPVVDARVVAHDPAAKDYTEARTTATGEFMLHVEQEAPNAVLVRAEDHESWGSMEAAEARHRPGDEPLDVVLVRSQRVRVQVVAAETGAPLEQCGVLTQRDTGANATERSRPLDARPAIERHTNGLIDVAARPGLDTLLVAAPGRRTERVDVAPQTGLGPVQVVALEPAALVTGRVLVRNMPLANATIRLAPARFDEPRITIRDRLQAIGYAGETPGPDDKDRWVAVDRTQFQWVQTTDDGRFEFEIRRNGHHHLAADVGDGLALTRYLLLDTRTPHDLGDIEAVPSGRIEGVVRAGSIDPSGLVVRLDRGTGRDTTTVDAAGRFVFEDVEPGRRLVSLDGRSGVLAAPSEELVAVKSGATATVEIDAEDCALGVLEVRVEWSGGTLPLRQANLRIALDSMPLHSTFDARGRARFEVSANTSGTFVLVDSSASLSFGDQPVEVRAGRTTEHVVRAELGTLDLLLPTSPPTAGRATLSLALGSTSADGRRQRLTIDLEGGVPEPNGWSVTAIEGGVRIPGALAGDVLLNASLTSTDGAARRLDRSYTLETGGAVALAFD